MSWLKLESEPLDKGRAIKGLVDYICQDRLIYIHPQYLYFGVKDWSLIEREGTMGYLLH